MIAPTGSKAAMDPAEEAVLDRWKLQKDDILFIEPDRLIEVGKGFALVKVIGKLTQVERCCLPQP